MSYSAPFKPNPDYDVDAALLDILVQTHHPALASGSAAEELARIEKQYQDRNAALVKEGEAAAAKIECLETEVCALEGDVDTQLAVLQDIRRTECVFVQTHIVPEKNVVLRVGEEMWSGIFKEA